jgi:acetoin utilization protein AcuB
MLVRDWMTRAPAAVTMDTRIRRACELMLEYGLRLLPVLDGKCRLLGVVTDRDLLAACGVQDDCGSHLLLDLVTLAPRAIDEDAPLECAISIFCEDRLRDALPVLKDDKFVGILTRHQIVRALAKLAVEGQPMDAAATSGDRKHTSDGG